MRFEGSLPYLQICMTTKSLHTFIFIQLHMGLDKILDKLQVKVYNKITFQNKDNMTIMCTTQ